MNVPGRGQVVPSAFRAHPLLRAAHLQTILPTLLRPLPTLALQIERLELDDGDFVDLGWSGPAEASRLAVLIHGLTGGFESKYLRGTALRLNALGWRTVALQLRGAGAEPNRTARYYNHGDTADLRHLWHLLRARHPQLRMATVGWSLGGNVLLNALAEEGVAAPLTCAVAACAPLEIEPCAERLRRGFSRLYQKRLLDALKDSLRARHARVPVPTGVDLAGTLRARDFFEFDDRYTAPLNGYRDACDYYARCSGGRRLHAIRVPTQVINAIDDPFMTPEILPPAHTLPANVTLELAAHGGHVGFIGADERWRPTCWLEQRIVEVLERALPA
ncbi:MAG TPA: hydrolase [Solimonas sp.]